MGGQDQGLDKENGGHKDQQSGNAGQAAKPGPAFAAPVEENKRFSAGGGQGRRRGRIPWGHGVHRGVRCLELWPKMTGWEVWSCPCARISGARQRQTKKLVNILTCSSFFKDVVQGKTGKIKGEQAGRQRTRRPPGEADCRALPGQLFTCRHQTFPPGPPPLLFWENRGTWRPPP